MSDVKGKDNQLLEGIDEYKYGFHDAEDKYVFKSKRGLSREVVEQIPVPILGMQREAA